MTNDKPAAPAKRDWRDSLAAWVAVAALLVFLVLVVLMVWRSNGDETSWSRLVYLLTGVEAVAFAGAGWVFGKEVHRAEVQRAEEQVQTEKQRTSEAEENARQAAGEARTATKAVHEEKLRGARMAQAVITAQAQERQPARQGGEQDVSAGAGSASSFDSVADLARQLYPDLRLDG